jgi:hypothetical protein
MNHKVAWAVAALVVVVVVVGLAFALGLVKYEPPRREESTPGAGAPIKVPGSSPKANPGGER